MASTKEPMLIPSPAEVVEDIQSPPTMHVRPCVSPWAGIIFVPKLGCLFLCLTLCVVTYILWGMGVMEIQRNEVQTSHQGSCILRPISYEETLEEEFILHNIAWPETPPVPFNYYLERTSDPACSEFNIMPRRIGGFWLKGDHLEVKVQMRDQYCSPKTTGGDVFLARLSNVEEDASVAGQVVDHGNGNYTAVFPLLWKGRVDIEITLVHPSEAVTVLRRLTRDNPDRIFFKSIFQSGLLNEATMCNICLQSTKRELCNYTDIHTGEPWFCLKPKSLSCDTRITHSKGGYLQTLRPTEDKLFQEYVNMKVPILSSGRSYITVHPKYEGRVTVKSQIAKSKPSGYYYKGVWRSLSHTEVHQFDVSSTVQCLRGKVVHMYGDSTIRQWYEYFNNTLQGLREFDMHSAKKIGPYMALDHENNILVTYRCHGPPIRFGNVKVNELYYIANEIDRIAGGANIVVVVGIWSHFSTFPMEVYIRRLMSIRSAVSRLLARAPDTTVVIRTGNPKHLKSLYETLTNSDWYSLQRDKALREVFKGMNVHLVDAWEMVLAHQLPHDLHPEPPIIKNMMNVLLSYICPAKIFDEEGNLK